MAGRIKTNDKQRVFTRRAVIFGGLQAAGLSLLAGRLYYLQFIRNEEYRTLSENNRVKLQLLVPERGRLLDRNGEPFAFNEKNYQLYLDATGLGRQAAHDLIRRVEQVVTLSDKLRLQAFEELKVNPYASTLLIREHLTWEEVAAIELHQLELPGIYIHIGSVRYYPLADTAAHLIGYVGAVSPEELEASGRQQLLRMPEYRIGKSGVEKLLEERLRGSPGIRQMEVNVHGQAVRELSIRDSTPGEDVRLTLDLKLQAFGANLVKDESAGCAVMDMTNGDMLALISTPAYDPNIFSKGIPTEYWKELHDSNRFPLINKVTQGLYSPGSTFKMLVGLAGLRKEVINPSTRVHCPGHYYLGDHRFNCWKEGGHGSVDLVGAIQQSCDTYFYTVAQRTGIDGIAEMSRLFGLGETKMLGLASEKAGLVPTPEWKQRRFKQKWTTGDTVNVGIGQGYVLSTPLHLAIMTARLATGRKVLPRLVTDGSTPEFEPMDVPEEHLRIIHQGMEAVTNSPGGTAFGKRITDPRYSMAGKTGTSQVRKILQRGMRQDLLPWEHRHHALFVGYAPIANPRYAVSVLIEHGGGGSSAAAPVARELLLKIQKIADGTDGEESPEKPA